MACKKIMSMLQLLTPFRASSRETVLSFENISSSGVQGGWGMSLCIMSRNGTDIPPSHRYIKEFWWAISTLPALQPHLIVTQHVWYRYKTQQPSCPHSQFLFCAQVCLSSHATISWPWCHLPRNDPTPNRRSQLPCAAALIISSFSFVHNLHARLLNPDNLCSCPLDMDQYMRLFGTAQIPTQVWFSIGLSQREIDQAGIKGLQDGHKWGCLPHCHPQMRTVLYVQWLLFCCLNNLIHSDWFDTLNNENWPLLTKHEALQNLQGILQDADRTPIIEVCHSTTCLL